jgi:outer membrane protein OmpA-like peptidoglycan-associated protein
MSNKQLNTSRYMKTKSVIIIILAAILTNASLMAQEKGLFLSLSGNYGANVFHYQLKDLNTTGNKYTPSQSEFPRSWGAGLALQYFFTKNWGMSLGFEWFDYNGKATFQYDWDKLNWKPGTHDIDDLEIILDKHNHLSDRFIYKEMQDYQGDNYYLMLGLSDWEEKQHGYIIQIPLMLQYQTKWGRKENIGMYFALGAKFQIPVLKQTYSTNGTLRAWAYYPRYDTYFHGDTTLPGVGNLHGFGQNDDTVFTGDNGLRFSGAASGELGLLFSFSRRVDFSIGAYLDYGFINIRKKTNTAENGALIMPDNNDPFALDKAEKVGDGLKYQGFFNSVATDKVNLLAVGAKASLRIKLTKLDNRDDKENMSDREFYESLFNKLIDTIVACQDTFIVNIPPQRKSYDDEDDDESEEMPMSQSARKLWNTSNPSSPNNPDNPNYAYPAWYTPDYVSNPQQYSKNNGGAGVGMSPQQEGPNNPTAVQRNIEKVQAVMNVIGTSVYFDLDSYELRNESMSILDEKIPILKQYPHLTIVLTGHTCDLAGVQYNDQLSYNRCKAVRDYLIKKGIKSSRIELIPMGLHHPDHPNNTEANRKLNRRVDCIVVQ